MTERLIRFTTALAVVTVAVVAEIISSSRRHAAGEARPVRADHLLAGRDAAPGFRRPIVADGSVMADARSGPDLSMAGPRLGRRT